MSRMVVEGDEEEDCSGGRKSRRVVRIEEPTQSELMGVQGNDSLNSGLGGNGLVKIEGSQGNVLHMLGSKMSNGRKASFLNSSRSTSRSNAGTPPPGPDAHSDSRGSNGYSISSDASVHSYDSDDDTVEQRVTNFKLGAAAASVADMDGGMDAHDSLGGGDSLSRCVFFEEGGGEVA